MQKPAGTAGKNPKLNGLTERQCAPRAARLSPDGAREFLLQLLEETTDADSTVESTAGSVAGSVAGSAANSTAGSAAGSTVKSTVDSTVNPAPDSIGNSAAAKKSTKNWRIDDGRLVGDFRFAGFAELSLFIPIVLAVAAAENHHPEVSFGYRRCEIMFTTHSAGGLSANDFICAAKISARAAGR